MALCGAAAAEPAAIDLRGRLLAAATGRLRGAGGVVLASPGDARAPVLVVCSGVVVVSRFDPRGREVIIDLRRDGAVLGLCEAAAGRPGRFHVRAVTDCEVATIPPASTQALIAGDPALAHAVLRLCVEEEDRAYARIESLKCLSAPARLAQFLLEWTPAGRGRGEVVLPCSRDMLAALLGVCPVTLSRAFSALRRYGVVSRQGRAVVTDTRLLLTACR